MLTNYYGGKAVTLLPALEKGDAVTVGGEGVFSLKGHRPIREQVRLSVDATRTFEYGGEPCLAISGWVLRLDGFHSRDRTEGRVYRQVIVTVGASVTVHPRVAVDDRVVPFGEGGAVGRVCSVGLPDGDGIRWGTVAMPGHVIVRPVHGLAVVERPKTERPVSRAATLPGIRTLDLVTISSGGAFTRNWWEIERMYTLSVVRAERVKLGTSGRTASVVLRVIGHELDREGKPLAHEETWRELYLTADGVALHRRAFRRDDQARIGADGPTVTVQGVTRDCGYRFCTVVDESGRRHEVSETDLFPLDATR